MDHQDAARDRSKSVPRASQGEIVATDKSFQQFLRAHRAKSVEVGNLSDRKDAWLGQVKKLYDSVLHLLGDHLKSGAIKKELRTVSIEEEPLGRYEAPSLVLDLGASKVEFKPIGTFLIGTPGRVDMVGLRSTIRFVLTTRDMLEPTLKGMMMLGGGKSSTLQPKDVAACVWKISTNPPRIKYSDITREALEKAIIEAVDG